MRATSAARKSIVAPEVRSPATLKKARTRKATNALSFQALTLFTQHHLKENTATGKRKSHIELFAEPEAGTRPARRLAPVVRPTGHRQGPSLPRHRSPYAPFVQPECLLLTWKFRLKARDIWLCGIYPNSLVSGKWGCLTLPDPLSDNAHVQLRKTRLAIRIGDNYLDAIT